MIGAYSQNGDAAKAIEFYGKMVHWGIKADSFLYPMILKSLAATKDLRVGQCIHADVIRNGLENDIVVMNSLIDMYVKCGNAVDSECVFDDMFFRDVFTWTTMLVGYLQAGRGSEAIQLFKEMLNIQVRPSSATLAALLPLFSEMGCFDMARQIHSLVAVSGFEYEKYVGTALVDMYANCGGLGYGRFIFDRIVEKDVSCWNTMIKGYIQVNLYDEAIALIKLMQLAGKHPTKSTWDYFFPRSGISAHGFLKLIKHMERAGIVPCAFSDTLLGRLSDNVETVEQVKELHLFFQKSGHISNSTVASSLIRMYAKYAELEVAREIFDCVDVKELNYWNSIIACYAYNNCADKAYGFLNEMKNHGIVPTVLSWNTVLAGYINIGDFEAALEMFYEMKWAEQKPNKETYNLILRIIGRLTSSMIGKQLHSMFLRTTSVVSKFVCTAFINMYGNIGNACYAMKLFNAMDQKDLVSWNAIISSLVKNGLLDEASRIFHEMNMSGFEGNIVTWTSLISGYSRKGQVDESLRLFREHQLMGLKPNSITIASILPACSQSATLSHGKSIHCYIIRNGIGLEDLFVLNAVVDMYMKCGHLYYSEQVFRRLHQKDKVSWNMMIQGYVNRGRDKDAISLFDQMLADGYHPDSVTFGGILSAYSHSGMVNEGMELFSYMESRFGVIPTGKHYACIVDLLGRAGLFEDIRNFIFDMSLQPTASLWGALLSACNKHGNVEMAAYAADHLIELQPENSEIYASLLNIYAKARKWDDFIYVKKLMESNGVEELPGCSWIEIGNSVHSFGPENFLGSEWKEEILVILSNLMDLVFEDGFFPEMIVNDSIPEPVLW